MLLVIRSDVLVVFYAIHYCFEGVCENEGWLGLPPAKTRDEVPAQAV